MFELGQQLSERYKKLLVDGTYTAQKAYFFSTVNEAIQVKL